MIHEQFEIDFEVIKLTLIEVEQREKALRQKKAANEGSTVQ